MMIILQYKLAAERVKKPKIDRGGVLSIGNNYSIHQP
jgi:hypothetical protein